MPKRSTVLTCTICTLAGGGGIGGLVYELQKPEENNYPETEKLAKQASDLNKKIKELYKELNNKISNDPEKNNDISKLIGLFFNLISLKIKKHWIKDEENISKFQKQEETINASILELKASIDPKKSKEIEEIAKNIALLKEDFIQKEESVFKEISELIKKITELIPEIKEAKDSGLNQTSSEDVFFENIRSNIAYFEIKKPPSTPVNFQEAKVNYEKEIKSKISMNSEAKKIYHEIVKKLSIWYKFNEDI